MEKIFEEVLEDNARICQWVEDIDSGKVVVEKASKIKETKHEGNGGNK